MTTIYKKLRANKVEIAIKAVLAQFRKQNLHTNRNYYFRASDNDENKFRP